MVKMTTKTETKITGVTLELTPIEAYVLNIILQNVSGSPDESFRKYTDGIAKSLDTVARIHNDPKDFSVSIYNSFGDLLDSHLGPCDEIEFKSFREVDDGFDAECYEMLAAENINRG